ncbi:MULTISPECIES: three-helix bundle dimerization domain-containing protein [unclassified Frankia]|uniref:three-helix bundle dimerization domain-containing protein n=1 Tax=unclassified Frankia TaxID=2632575 RepID=UPI001EF50B3B|nr:MULTISPECIES: hypothetical protein [unclassified Frankia]
MNLIPVRDEFPERITILIQRLQTAYDGTVPGPTVEAVVRSCYAPLTHATITHYVPNLVEHASRDRLQQLITS